MNTTMMVGTMILNSQPDDALARAEAILRDHAEGLHHPLDRDDICRYAGCDDAFWLVARAQEHQPWAL